MGPTTVVLDLLDLLAPPRCVACGGRGRQPWCGPCEAAARRLRVTSGCRRCGNPDARHGCWAAEAPVDRSVAALRYTGPVAAAVVAGKARGARAVWRPLGEELARAVAVADLPPGPIVPIPTDPARRRRRGVDHPLALAGPVADSCGRPVLALLDVARRRPDQTELPLHVRRRLPAGTFVPSGRLDGAHVLLVDDVLTTGATLVAAAHAVLAAGAESVSAAVLARAGDHVLGAPSTG